MSRQVARNHQPRVSLKDAVQELAVNLAQVWGAQPRIQNVEQNPTQKDSGADGCGGFSMRSGVGEDGENRHKRHPFRRTRLSTLPELKLQ